MLEKWIAQCDEMSSDENIESAQFFINVVADSVKLEIPRIAEGLSCYHNYVDDDADAVCFDLQILKGRLALYLEKITRSAFIDGSSIVNVNNNPSFSNDNMNHQEAVISVSQEQTINRIQELPSTLLQDQDKKEILEILQKIEENTRDRSLWNRALHFLADKGVDTALAVLPYLGKIAQSLLP